MGRLCRNDEFALLKLDACASNLRPEKEDAFVRIMMEDHGVCLSSRLD